MLSKYTDKDYPLYIVQYISSKFESEYERYLKTQQETCDFDISPTIGYKQHCGTESIAYYDLCRLLEQIKRRWYKLDEYLHPGGEVPKAPTSDSEKTILAFAADRLNEIRFLFKDADYEFEGEVRVIYTDSTDESLAKTTDTTDVPRVYVDIDRKLEDLTIRLGSKIDDATVDKYVTWLKHTGKVSSVRLAKRNRYTN